MISGQEPHLGHVVGLVEDGDLDVAELDGAALDEVVQTARRGDEEVDATVEGGDLGGVAEAAGDELVAQAHDVHERLQRVGHLHGQLAGGHEDQGSRTTRGGARCVVGEAGDGREAEGQRLAGAGPAASEHVAAGEAVGDRGGLDREGLGDAVAGQSLDEPLGQAECGERVVGRDIDRTGAHRATGGLGPRVGGDPLGLGVDAAWGVTGDVAAGRVRLVCGAIVVRRTAALAVVAEALAAGGSRVARTVAVRGGLATDGAVVTRVLAHPHRVARALWTLGALRTGGVGAAVGTLGPVRAVGAHGAVRADRARPIARGGRSARDGPSGRSARDGPNARRGRVGRREPGGPSERGGRGDPDGRSGSTATPCGRPPSGRCSSEPSWARWRRQYGFWARGSSALSVYDNSDSG